MKDAARLSLRKALRKLREAEIIDVERAPGAVVHSGYYAMLHAAKAFVLQHSTMEPRKHGSVIGEFGRLLKDEPENVKEHGRIINRAQTLRDADDYDVEQDIEVVDAEELRASRADEVLAVRQQHRILVGRRSTPRSHYTGAPRRLGAREPAEQREKNGAARCAA